VCTVFQKKWQDTKKTEKDDNKLTDRNTHTLTLQTNIELQKRCYDKKNLYDRDERCQNKN
jgi:hypothetical protein